MLPDVSFVVFLVCYYLASSVVGPQRRPKPKIIHLRRTINKLAIHSGVYIFLLDPKIWAKIWPNNRLGKKNYWKGMKKGGKCIFFPKLVKSMHIFPPIDLKYTKLQKKGWQLFVWIKLSWGKNINQEGGGGPKIWI